MDAQTEKLFSELHRKIDQIICYIIAPEQMKALQGHYQAPEKIVELNHTLGLILESFTEDKVPS